MTRYLFFALIAVLTLNTGCKLIYKQNVQQGNAHEQEDLDQIQLGMSKKQVAYLLGTPAVADPFHQDRWDYISMLSRRGGEPVRRLVTLTFENDSLVATDGIGDSTGGDIKALADTSSAVADINDLETAKRTKLITDDGVINWTLQMGAFSTHDEAEAFAEKVRSKGFDVRLREKIVPGLGTRHQVRSGLYDTYNEAQAQLIILEKALNVAGITVPVDIPIEK
ncbi:MAG: outer membrane protein assembly factor BamE [Lysobacterales bacterium]|jgi:outer membrane protein assembly factor BamE (lipoprotein component of BamABCDE complex)